MPMSPEDRRELELLKAEIGYDDRHPAPYWPIEPMSVDSAWDEIASFFGDHYPDDWKTPFYVFMADTFDCPISDVIEENAHKFEDIPLTGPVPNDACTRISNRRPGFH
ncbi:MULTISPECIES: hypothetical protein [unclassified Pannonibacter]|uniref:hypothetical protein n=1 Tax=unclassified Pannonibacter TaxID=2627228 RepID=UPI001647D1C6|nr:MULTISPECIES: hypothetical protein [unclassified Pannonibacter]